MKGAPTQLFEEILQQKEMCNEMLRSKNSLIEMLEQENRSVDESYKQLIGKWRPWPVLAMCGCRGVPHQHQRAVRPHGAPRPLLPVAAAVRALQSADRLQPAEVAAAEEGRDELAGAAGGGRPKQQGTKHASNPRILETD